MWLRWSGHDGIRTLHHGAGLARGWTERDVDGLDGWVALVDGPVFTPTDLRRRGYASPVVAAASAHALAQGTREVLLCTDLANPTSNSIYQKLGYRPVQDSVTLDLTD